MLKEVKSQMDSCYKNSENDFSLYYGKTGLCIAYFIISRIFDDKDADKRANSILKELSENFKLVQDLGFEKGIAGIGWGIEWLAQNNFIAIDTDEILEDLDDELYRAVVYSKSINLSLSNGALSKALYFYKRLLSKSPKQIRFRRILILECLVLLTDEIYDTVQMLDMKQRKGGVSENVTLIELANCLLFTTKLIPLNINSEVCDQIVVKIISFIESYHRVVGELSTGNCPNAYKLMLYSLYTSGQITNKSHWRKKAVEYYKQSLFHDTMKIEDNPFDGYEKVVFNNIIIGEKTSVFSILSQISTLVPSDKNYTYSWEEAWLLR